MKLESPIPYGRQSIGEEEIEEVLKVLRSSFLTQGPTVAEFEQSVADYCGAKYAVAVSSGTAALHAAYAAFGIGPGDSIVTSPITFAATSNAALYLGARAVFADVDPDTGILSPQAAATRIEKNTKAIVPVDFAGRPAPYDEFAALAKSSKIPLIADSCHALGALYQGKRIGTLADATVFSFHPVKTITTAEGGMVLTDRRDIAEKMRRFRHHGIEKKDGWHYDLEELGNNYRLSDLHAALGLGQMRKIDKFLKRRREIAAQYDSAFANHPYLRSTLNDKETVSAYHLYVLRLREEIADHRKEIFEALRARNLGVHVHYIPVYQHPYYRKQGYAQNECPVAESFYQSSISLPIFPAMSDREVERVTQEVLQVLKGIEVATNAKPI